MENLLIVFDLSWNPYAAVIMFASNLLAILIGRYSIKIRGLGPTIPLGSSDIGEFGLPELLATTSLGHIIGAGTIIGLFNMGILPH
nr:photosystem I subunit X [Cavernulicola chilensis]